MTRSRLAAAVLVGTALYAVAIYLVVTADLGEPRALITMVTVAGLIFSVAGTIAAIQRPDNRTGAQMLAVGLLWSVGALQLADSPLVFTIGYLLSGLAFVAFAHLILSYPSGRLRPGDEWIVWAVLAIVTLGPLAISLFDRSPIPACDDCPESAFLVTDSTALARAAGSALGLAAAGIATVVFVRLIRRFRAASPPLRRALGPVYFFTLIALVGLVTSNLAWTFDENAGLAIEIAALAALALMPVAFLAGILRTRLQRAGIADLVIALGNGRPLRDALSDALGDPSLGLAYWSSQRQAWVDEEGRTMTEPIARGAHAATFVENDGKRVAALLHDRSLADQRPLVDAVAATAGLAFEKERLQAELRAQYRFLETIIDTAPSLLSVVDTEGRIRNFNQAVEIASGLQGRALVEGRFFWEIFIDPAEREAMIQRFRDASPGFPASAYENVFTNALGEERVIAWQTAPLVDQNGDVVRIVAGGIDITDRKHRELELQRQWDFATTVADTIPSFIVITDHDAVVARQGANRAFCDVFGRSEEELEGTSFLDLVAREDEFAARMAIAGAANGVPQAERESRWLTRDGGERTSRGRPPRSRIPPATPGCSSPAPTSPTASARRPRSERRGAESWPRRTPPGAGSNATCTTAHSSGWPRSRSRFASPSPGCPTRPRRPWRSSPAPGSSSRRRSRSSASWRAASTRTSSPTAASARRSSRSSSARRSRSRSTCRTSAFHPRSRPPRTTSPPRRSRTSRSTPTRRSRRSASRTTTTAPRSSSRWSTTASAAPIPPGGRGS